MTEYRIPFDGVEYDSEIWRIMQSSMMNSGDTPNSGVLPTPTDGSNPSLQVTQTASPSKQVLIKLGAGIVDGLWYYNDALSDVLVTIPDNTDGSGFDRIHLIVLRSNSTTKTCTPTVIEGTPSASPVAPSPIRTGAIFDIELAEVTAQNLFTTIVNADIDNSVRTIAPLWQTTQGGTGRSEYSDGEFLIGNASGGLGFVQLINKRVFVGQAGGITPSQISLGGILIRPSSPLSGTGSGSFVTVPLDIVANDTLSYVTSISGGAFTLEEGEYIIWGAGFTYRTASTTRVDINMRLRNTTTASNLKVQSVDSVVSIGFTVGQATLAPSFYTSNGSDQLELQIQHPSNNILLGAGSTQELFIQRVA